MKNHSYFLQVESDFYRGVALDAPSIESQLLQFLLRKDWDGLFALAEKAFESSQEISEKVFILQIAVVAAEIKYDISLRDRWIARWNQIEGWSQSAYCLYLRAYQDGVDAFFKGYLREAEERFIQSRELCSQIQSEYSFILGEIKCLVHVGLIARDQRDLQKANFLLSAALEVSTKGGFVNLTPRIQSHLDEVMEQDSINTLFTCLFYTFTEEIVKGPMS